MQDINQTQTSANQSQQKSQMPPNLHKELQKDSKRQTETIELFHFPAKKAKVAAVEESGRASTMMTGQPHIAAENNIQVSKTNC